MKIEIKPTLKQHLVYEALKNPDVSEIFFGGGAGGGKIVKNDSKILTLFGWKKGIDLKVGDLINNPDGSVQRIIQIKQEIELEKWTVRFSDGTKLEVAEDHLWLAWKGGKGRKIKNEEVCGINSAEVIETRELQEWLARGYNPQIPVCEEQPFSRNSRSKIDRYLLGAFLGDGCSYKDAITITCSEEDKEHYKKNLSKHTISYCSYKTCNLIGETRIEFLEYLKHFKLLHKKSFEKFIPKEFLFDSLKNRYLLAQGLMDTDGYSAPDKNGCYYYTVSKQLAYDVVHLMRSLGAVVTITKNPSSYKKDGKKVACRDCYDVYIKHRNPDKLFRMKRKKNGFSRKELSKKVIGVEAGGKVKGRCITVSNPNGLYITDDFIVTHNSWLICESRLINCYLYPGYKSYIGRNELTRLMQSTYLTFCKVCKFHKIPQSDWKLNGQYHFIEFKNGSRIDLLDLAFKPADPMYERFGSLEFTDGAIEEAGEVPFLGYDTLKSRVDRHLNKELGIKATTLITGNPKKNWTHREFYQLWKKNELPKDKVFVQSLYGDNPFTADSYGRQLAKIKDKITKQRLMLGNWDYDADPTTLMDYDAIIDLFTNSVIEKKEKYLVADIARFGKDKTTISLWKGLEAYRILTYKKQGIDQTIEVIKQLSREEQIPYSQILADEDGVGCLIKGTKVMTIDGWINVENIRKGDLLFSKNSEGVVCKEKVHRNKVRKKEEEETEIIELDNGYTFSFSHFLPYKVKNEYKFNLGSWDTITNRDRIILDNDFIWKGKSFDFVIPEVKGKMPNGGEKIYKKEIKIEGTNFAEFLGWFISEGCFDKTAISISQEKNSRFLKEIEKTLNNCGFDYYKKEHNHEYFYLFSNKNLKEWLEKNCYTDKKKHISLTKKVPDIIKNANKEIIRAFLEAYNYGDGWLHHKELYYSTSSKKLADDILELIFKKGKYGNIKIKHKKGSVGFIGKRKLIRTTDNYVIYEFKNKKIGIRPKVKRKYLDDVYDVGITGNTKLFMVKFSDGKAFWVHNGGVVDGLKGIKGFIANTTPYKSIDEEMVKTTNYQSLKAQCAYKLADYVNEHKIAIKTDSSEVKESLIEELEQIKSKDPDKDSKLNIISKEIVKEAIGRSPDYSDLLLMRMYFEVDKIEDVGGVILAGKNAETQSANPFDDLMFEKKATDWRYE